MKHSFRTYFTICLSAFLLASCASTHPGIVAESYETNPYKSLKISSHFREDLSDANNFYYELTFENKEGQWIRIDEADIDFPPNSGGPYNVIKGNDLVAWAESLRLKSQTRDFNEGILVAGAILGGLTMAALGDKNDAGMKSAGAMVAGAGVVYSATKAMSGGLNSAQAAEQLPENHLFKPFVIPANGLARKWILWSVPSGKIAQYAKLKMKTVEGEQMTYLIRFWE